MRKFVICLVLIATVCGESTASDKILLLDDRVIDRVENAILRVGEVQKHPSDPLFGEDKPWELRLDNMYPTVVFDAQEGIYRCWYNTFLEDVYIWNWAEMGLCYATSRDGLRWEKPELGVVEFNGNKANNLVARRLHGAGGQVAGHRSAERGRFPEKRSLIAASAIALSIGSSC